MIFQRNDDVEAYQRYWSSKRVDQNHASEPEPKRDLSGNGYTFDADDGSWHKVLRQSKHTARKDHKDGRIKAGEVYWVDVVRYVDDETGHSNMSFSKHRYLRILSTD